MKEGTKNLGILLFFMLFFGLASGFFGPEVGYDFANYHLYNGYALIHGRIFQDIAPAGAWSYFNPLMDGVTYLLVMHFSAIWSTFFMGSLNGFLGFFTYKLAHEIFNKNSGQNRNFYCWGAVLLALSAPAVFHMIGSAHGDLNSSIFILIGLWLVAKNLNTLEGLGMKNALWIGVFSGIAVGLKLTQLPFGLGVGAGFWFLWIMTGRFKPVIGFALGSLLGFLLTDGWWMALLYIHYGNPLFPFFNQFFHSPFFGVAGSDPTFRIHSWGQLLKLPLSLIAPDNHVNEGVILDLRLIAVFILGSIFWVNFCFYGRANFSVSSPLEGEGRVGGRCRGELSQFPTTFLLIGFLSWFFLTSYISWGFLFGIYRYAVPMQLVSGILVVYFLRNLLVLINKDPLERLGFFIVIVGLMFLLTGATVKNAQPVPANEPYVYLIDPPKIPENSMILMAGPDVLTENGMSFVVPLLRAISPSLLSAVYPNFYPENSMFWSKGALWLKTGDLRNLSVNKILSHKGPLFLLIRVQRPYLTSVKNEPKPGDVRLIFSGFRAKTRACPVFKTSIPWVGGLALCEVKLEEKEKPRVD